MLWIDFLREKRKDLLLFVVENYVICFLHRIIYKFSQDGLIRVRNLNMISFFLNTII